MKRKTLCWTAAALLAAMLSGCGSQTTAEPANLNQTMLIEKSAKEQTAYSFPNSFTGDWTAQEGKLSIHADAQVVAEQGVVLPVASVTPGEFTQADVDNLLRVLLKSAPLYGYTQTKQELQESLDRINSPEWSPDPDAPALTAEQRESRRDELAAYYSAEIAKAPEEKPVIHGFSDSDDPKAVRGSATVDGVVYDVSIDNNLRYAQIIRRDYKYSANEPAISRTDIFLEEAVDLADALMQELGLAGMALDDAQEWEKTIRECRFSHFPIIDSNQEDVVGILDTKDYFRSEDKSKEYVMKNAVDDPYFVPENMKANILFAHMKKVRIYFAVVLDEYGGMSGIVTLHDLVEALVGELEEEEMPAKPEDIKKIKEDVWRIQGCAQLDEVSEALGVEFPEVFDTFSGFVWDAIGRVPAEGEKFSLEVNDLKIDVKNIENHMVDYAIVRKVKKRGSNEADI